MVFVLASLLSACAVGPGYTPPDVDMPAGWHEAQAGGSLDRSALEHWWNAFGDPVLDDLVTRAIADDPDLKIAAARVREARAARGIAASAALPQLDVGGRRPAAGEVRRCRRSIRHRDKVHPSVRAHRICSTSGSTPDGNSTSLAASAAMSRRLLRRHRRPTKAGGMSS